MNTLKTWMVAGSVLLVISAANPALGNQHHECVDLMNHESLGEHEMLYQRLLEEHEMLYQYSLVAGIPSNQSDHICNKKIQNELRLDLQDFKEITPQWLKKKKFPQWLKERGFREMPPFYMNKNNENNWYIACPIEGTSFWILSRFILKKISESPLVVVVEVLFGRSTSDPINEELEFVVLRYGETSDDPETLPGALVAIRGTDWRKNEQWLTNLKGLYSSSCAFGFMVEFVEFLSKDGSTNELVVVGHSLGGTATQHIAQKAKLGEGTTLNAYAYAALGLLKKESENASGSNAIVSYLIDGDRFVNEASSSFGTQQIGRIVEYEPVLWWKERWRCRHPVKSIERHLIKSIQEALCKCIAGTGSLCITDTGSLSVQP